MPSRFIPTADTDFILLVTARPIPSDGSGLRTLAYATTCQEAYVPFRTHQVFFDDLGTTFAQILRHAPEKCEPALFEAYW